VSVFVRAGDEKLTLSATVSERERAAWRAGTRSES
jgi:hypothetical protein